MEDNKIVTNVNLASSLGQNIGQTKDSISNNLSNEIIDISSKSINEQISYLANTVASLDNKNNASTVYQKKLTK